MQRYQLNGLLPYETHYHELVVNEAFRILFDEGGGFPPLRSDVLHILRDTSSASPFHDAGAPLELIVVNSKENRPYQFAYQLAHELGHVAARANLRFPRSDGKMWIEESICGCYSLILLHRLAADEGPLREGATSYLAYLEGDYPTVAIDHGWFEGKQEALAASMALTPDSKVVARYLFSNLPASRICKDNLNIREIPVGLPMDRHLKIWADMAGADESIPTLLGRFCFAKT